MPFPKVGLYYFSITIHVSIIREPKYENQNITELKRLHKNLILS